MKHPISIGISSIIFIFMILCLAVFGMLSFSDAKSTLTFAEKHADTVRMYYESDAAAQTFIRDYRSAYQNHSKVTDALSEASERLPEGSRVSYLKETNTILCEISMPSGQTLHLELNNDGIDILAYYVYNSTDYMIDSDLPVWSGY